MWFFTSILGGNGWPTAAHSELVLEGREQMQVSEDHSTVSSVDLVVNMSDLHINEDTRSTSREESQVFVAKGHPSEAFERMQQMREEQKLCDVVLEVEGEEILAHRLVLAASSQYFFSMFAGSMRESRQERVELKAVEANAMRLLVEFAYTCKLEITTVNVQSVMMAASIYSFPSVFEAAAKFLEGQLHPSNCLGIRSFARMYGSDRLVQIASEYFRTHFIDAIKNEEFLSLSGDDLAWLLDSDDVNVRSEEDVYRAVESWLSHHTEERVSHLPALIRVVRLPLLSTSFLTEQVEANPHVHKSLKCRDYLDDAKNFHLMPEKFWRSMDRRFHPRKSTVGMLFAVGGRGAVGEPFSSVECYNFRYCVCVCVCVCASVCVCVCLSHGLMSTPAHSQYVHSICYCNTV